MSTQTEYIQANKDRFLNELLDLLRIPSVSARSENNADTLRCAEAVAQKLRDAGADKVEVCPTAGHAIVYGEKIINPALPTVLVYGHYDVQPADPLNLWHRDPFDPAIEDTPKGKVIRARGACDEAAAENLSWLKPARMVICLGSPHRGAPLAKLGHLATAALHLSKVTAPLAKIAAARSAGVKDLRHGLRAQEERTQAAAMVSSVAYRFISANLTEDPDHPLGHILGDGLVTLGSATPPKLADDVDSVCLGGLGHMALLNEPRAYEWIRQWLGVPS